jgi:MFS family permease
LLVTEQELHNSLTWSSGVFQLSAIGGPLLGGALIGITGKAWPAYATSAVLCVIAAATSLRLRPRKIVRTSNERYTIAGITKGAGHLWREKTVLAALALDLFAVLLGGATALMPLYAEILGVGPIGLGALKAAPYIGAFLMAIVLAYRRPSNRNGQALLLSVAGFGLATIGFGVSTSFWLSLVLLALLGGLDNISVVIRSVLVQVRTPDELRGRVSAVNSLFIEASNELGAYESGLVASWFGPVVSVVSGGVGTLVVVAGIALAWPELRRLGRLVPLDE